MKDEEGKIKKIDEQIGFMEKIKEMIEDKGKFEIISKEARKYETADDFKRALFDNNIVKYHISSNSDLKEFIDIKATMREIKILEDHRHKINDILRREQLRASRTLDWITFRSLSDKYYDDLVGSKKIILEMKSSLPEIGKHGLRGGEGIYMTSRPDEWIYSFKDQEIDIGEYVYEVFITNPRKRVEYPQVAGSGEVLPETMIQHNEGIILGKRGEVDYNKIFEEGKQK